MVKALTVWMDEASTGSLIYFRKFPYSEQKTDEFYEKMSDGTWTLFGNAGAYRYTTDSFSDDEDNIFLREEG